MLDSVIIHTMFLVMVSLFCGFDKIYDFSVVPLWILLFLFSFVLVDQVLLPFLTGTTVSRWLCSYSIIDRNSGGQLLFKQALTRYLTIYILEIVTIFGAAISLSIILFRKDKSALHDLVSKTQVVLNNRTTLGFRIFKVLIIVAIVVVSALLTMNLVVYMADNVFVKPSSFVSLDSGYPRYYAERNIKEIKKSGRVQKEYIKFNSFYLLENTFNNDIKFVKEKNDKGIKRYIADTGNAKIIITIQDEPHPLFDRGITPLSVLQYYPFIDPMNIVAKKTFHHDDQSYSVLSPINNIVYFFMRINCYTIFSKDTFLTLSGETHFACVDRITTDTGNVFLRLFSFDHESMTSVYIQTKSENEEDSLLLNRIANEIYIE